jgi:predicted RNA binding protein YcfA (HicA-like mRNA interferase family)
LARLPSISAKQMIRALKKAGFEIYRQIGSHITLVNESIDRQVTIPMHKTVKPGTLHNILKQAGISRDELRKLL